MQHAWLVSLALCAATQPIYDRRNSWHKAWWSYKSWLWMQGKMANIKMLCPMYKLSPWWKLLALEIQISCRWGRVDYWNYGLKAWRRAWWNISTLLSMKIMLTVVAKVHEQLRKKPIQKIRSGPDYWCMTMILRPGTQAYSLIIHVSAYSEVDEVSSRRLNSMKHDLLRVKWSLMPSVIGCSSKMSTFF